MRSFGSLGARSFDAIVIGGGVIGSSTAFHLAKLGAKVAVLDKASQVGMGASGRSSGMTRLHYSVESNAVLAKRAMHFFHNFSDELKSTAANSGYVQTGHMMVARDDKLGKAMQKTVEWLRDKLGCDTQMISKGEASAMHPYVNLDDVDLVGWEPGSGFADPYLTCTSFAQAAKEHGAVFFGNCEVTGLLEEGGRVRGVETSTHGVLEAGVTVSCLNIWTKKTLGGWLAQIGANHINLPVSIEKHLLVALRVPGQPYMHPNACSWSDLPASQVAGGGMLPNVKDLIQDSKPYFRAYDGGSSILIGDNHPNTVESVPDDKADDGDWDESVSMEQQMHCAELGVTRFVGFDEAEIFSDWSGCYDCSPDYNPILGKLPEIDGLRAAFGFSGHGFKLSPVIGAMLAGDALGESTTSVLGGLGLVDGKGEDVNIKTYSYDRFEQKQELTGSYRGAGA